MPGPGKTTPGSVLFDPRTWAILSPLLLLGGAIAYWY